MTYKLTIRTAPGALIAAEYECPVHGRFAVDVPRDANGDPPGDAPCPMENPAWAVVNGVKVGHEDEGDVCERRSRFVISAPGVARVRKVEAIRGSYQRPERETWTDTTSLGEGQDLDDWKADRAKVWERENERQAMELAREL